MIPVSGCSTTTASPWGTAGCRSRIFRNTVINRCIRHRRYVIAFNGEIYNFIDLKNELEKTGHRFQGHSDTEILLAAIEEWGIEAAIKRFTGMFAFALWDRKERMLTLARDRMGEKPALLRLTRRYLPVRIRAQGHAGASRLAGRHRPQRTDTVPAAQLHPGAVQHPPRYPQAATGKTILQLPGTTRTGELPSPRPYWDIRNIAAQGSREQLDISDEEAVAELDSMLRSTIRRQMIADVPLGAFLSGGYDYSAIVALMQAQSSRRIRTFTIGFHEQAYNEAEHARRVADHLGTEHTELYVAPDQAIDVIPRLPKLYDEPFADSSQIPTYLVAAMTREHVTVSLSGDGGDELFAGYDRYAVTNAIWHKIRRVPYPLRMAAARAIQALDPKVLNTLLKPLGPALKCYGGQGLVGDNCTKVPSCCE